MTRSQTRRICDRIRRIRVRRRSCCGGCCRRSTPSRHCNTATTDQVEGVAPCLPVTLCICCDAVLSRCCDDSDAVSTGPSSCRRPSLGINFNAVGLPGPALQAERGPVPRGHIGPLAPPDASDPSVPAGAYQAAARLRRTVRITAEIRASLWWSVCGGEMWGIRVTVGAGHCWACSARRFPRTSICLQSLLVPRQTARALSE